MRNSDRFFAELAQLRPLEEWFDPFEVLEEILANQNVDRDEERRRLQRSKDCSQKCVGGWVESTPDAPKIPCGFCLSA